MDNRKKIILVVDDEVAVLEVIGRFLDSEGYTVLSVDNTQAAIQIASDVKVDLLLADVFMPTLSAKALANRISRVQVGMKVIFMTGYSRETMIDHGVVPMGAAVLQKPISKRDLLRQVHDTFASGTCWPQAAPGVRSGSGSLLGTGNAPDGNSGVTGY